MSQFLGRLTCPRRLSLFAQYSVEPDPPGSGPGLGHADLHWPMMWRCSLLRSSVLQDHPGLRGTPLAMMAALCNKTASMSPPPLADAAVGKGFHPWKKSGGSNSPEATGSGGRASQPVTTSPAAAAAAFSPPPHQATSPSPSYGKITKPCSQYFCENQLVWSCAVLWGGQTNANHCMPTFNQTQSVPGWLRRKHFSLLALCLKPHNQRVLEWDRYLLNTIVRYQQQLALPYLLSHG